MVGWQRNLRVFLRHAGTRVEQHQILPVNMYSTHVKPCTLLPGRYVHRGFGISARYTESLSQRHIQFSGFFTSRNLLADVDGKLVPISSPLTPPSPTSTEKSERAVISKREKVHAVLKGIRQSPKKVNLVARLVRGMPVEDALLQLQVTVKRAAKTVYKVIKSARANASHNHGLDADRLLVEEAFVGKGLFLKRLSYHAKGRCGVMVRPHCRLTVVVREMTAEEETKIAKLKVMNYKRLTRKEKQLVPHQLIETTPRWSRRPKVHSSV